MSLQTHAFPSQRRRTVLCLSSRRVLPNCCRRFISLCANGLWLRARYVFQGLSVDIGVLLLFFFLPGLPLLSQNTLRVFSTAWCTLSITVPQSSRTTTHPYRCLFSIFPTRQQKEGTWFISPRLPNPEFGVLPHTLVVGCQRLSDVDAKSVDAVWHVLDDSCMNLKRDPTPI